MDWSQKDLYIRSDRMLPEKACWRWSGNFNQTKPKFSGTIVYRRHGNVRHVLSVNNYHIEWLVSAHRLEQLDPLDAVYTVRKPGKMLRTTWVNHVIGPYNLRLEE